MSGHTKAQIEEAESRRKRNIAVVLVIVALVLDIGGLFLFPSVPQIRAYSEEAIYLDNFGSVGAPPYAIFVQLNLTGTSISANNVVTVTVTIIHTNVSNFLEHYNGVGLTNGFDQNTIQSSSPQLERISLSQTANGNFTGTGKVNWLSSGGTWLFLWPNKFGTYYTNYTQIEVGSPIYNIAGESDTLSVQDSLTTQKLTYILIGFSVLMLQPVLEAIRKIQKAPIAQNPH